MIYLLFVIGFFFFLGLYFFVREREDIYKKNSGITAAIFTLKKRRRLQYLVKYLLIIIAAAFLISLLTFRDISVGTDTVSYDIIYTTIFTQGMHYSAFAIEYGSYLLMLLGHTVFGSFTGVKFVFACVTIIPVMFGITYFSKKIPWPVLAAAYIAILFPSAFNEMRQLAAISLIFFALKYIDGKNYFAFTAFVIFATFLHNSAIVAIIILLLQFVSYRGKIIKLTTIAIIITLPLWSKYVVNYVLSFELFEKYAINYIFNDATWSEIGSALADQISTFGFMIAGMVLLSYKLIKNDKFNYVILATAAIAFSASILVIYNEWAYRISYIFYPAIVYAVASLPTAFKNNEKIKLIISIAVILCMICYSYISHYLNGWNDIFPYSFEIIKDIYPI